MGLPDFRRLVTHPTPPTPPITHALDDDNANVIDRDVAEGVHNVISD